MKKKIKDLLKKEQCNCGNQQINVSKIDFSKFGTCPKCILFALIGTIMGWVLLIGVNFIMPMDTMPLIIISTIPILFSFFLLAHLIGYLKNKVPS